MEAIEQLVEVLLLLVFRGSTTVDWVIAVLLFLIWYKSRDINQTLSHEASLIRDELKALRQEVSQLQRR